MLSVLILLGLAEITAAGDSAIVSNGKHTYNC